MLTEVIRLLHRPIGLVYLTGSGAPKYRIAVLQVNILPTLYLSNIFFIYLGLTNGCQQYRFTIDVLLLLLHTLNGLFQDNPGKPVPEK